MSLSVSHDYTVTGSRIPRTRLLRNSRLSAQSGSRFARKGRGKKFHVFANNRENSRKFAQENGTEVERETNKPYEP